MWSLSDSSTACSCFSKPLSSTVTMEMNRKVLKTYFENSPNNFQQVLQCWKNYCWCVIVYNPTVVLFSRHPATLASESRWVKGGSNQGKLPVDLSQWSDTPCRFSSVVPQHSVFSVPELTTAVHLIPVIFNAVLIRSEHIKRGGVAPI